MSNTAIWIDHVSKEYRLGMIGGRTAAGRNRGSGQGAFVSGDRPLCRCLPFFRFGRKMALKYSVLDAKYLHCFPVWTHAGWDACIEAM